MNTAIIAFGFAVALAVWAAADALAAVSWSRLRRTAIRPGRARSRARPAPDSPLVRGLIRAGHRAGLAVTVAGAEQQLLAAGRPFGMRHRDYGALCAGSAAAAVAFSSVWANILPGRLGVLVLIVSPVVGAALPGLALRRVIAGRQATMRREVADVLDLLRMLVGAGRSVERALAAVGHQRRGLLAAELGRAAHALDLGMPRTDVYKALAARCPIETMGQVVAALQRSARYGVGVDEALHALAAQARTQYVLILRERGARAAPQIQLVVALVIVPSVMLLVAASLVHGLT